MDENKEIDINLTKIFEMLKKKAVFIIVVGIIGAIISGCVTNFFIEPQYTASVKLHAYSNSDNKIGASSDISSGQIDASQKLINTYLEIIMSRTFLEKVADSVGNVTAAQLGSMISCSHIEDTVAFRVSVTSTSPELATNIANTVAELCPDEIIRVLKVGGVEVIDYATVPTDPSSPNLPKNIVIGFGAGFVLAFLYFFIRELFDTKIHDRGDLEKEFDIPILGMIPRIIPVSETSDTDRGGKEIDPPKPHFNSAESRKESK